MKTFLIVGLGLMTAAAVYGFVDYNKTRHNTAFEKMYHEPVAAPVTTPATPVAKTDETGEEIDAVVAAADKKATAEKKTVRKVKTKKVNVTATEIPEVKERKLDIRMFSRAPLKEFPVEKTEVKEKEKTITNEKPASEN